MKNNRTEVLLTEEDQEEIHRSLKGNYPKSLKEGRDIIRNNKKRKEEYALKRNNDIKPLKRTHQ